MRENSNHAKAKTIRIAGQCNATPNFSPRLHSELTRSWTTSSR